MYQTDNKGLITNMAIELFMWLAAIGVGTLVGQAKGDAKQGMLWGLFLGPVGVIVAAVKRF